MRRALGVVMALALLVIAMPAASTTAAAPKCAGVVANKVGTNGADTIRGTAGRDVIVARGGNDKVNGRGGNDIICGGAGADRLSGSSGSDKLLGQDGADILIGGDGNDTLNGGVGIDDCRPGAGSGLVTGCEYADYSITISDCPESATPGDSGTPGELISCTVAVTNHGPGAFTYEVSLSDREYEGLICWLNPAQSGSTFLFPALPPGQTNSFEYPFDCRLNGSPAPDGPWARMAATARPINAPPGLDLSCGEQCIQDQPNGALAASNNYALGTKIQFPVGSG
jgi:hypothetical protein